MAAPSCTWSPPTPQDTSSSVSGAATVEGVLWAGGLLASGNPPNRLLHFTRAVP